MRLKVGERVGASVGFLDRKAVGTDDDGLEVGINEGFVVGTVGTIVGAREGT